MEKVRIIRACAIFAVALMMGSYLSMGCGSDDTPTTDGPAAPALTADSIVSYDSKNVITWTDVDGATTYNLYWSTEEVTASTSKAVPTELNTIEGVTSPYSHESYVDADGNTVPLANGTTYNYRMKASDADGNLGDYSDSISDAPVGPALYVGFDTDGVAVFLGDTGAAIPKSYDVYGMVTYTDATDGEERIVVSGREGWVTGSGEEEMDHSCMMVWLYKTDGTLDTAFDTDGYYRKCSSIDTETIYNEKVALDSNNRFIVAGRYVESGEAYLARFNGTGLDTTFGDSDGFVNYQVVADAETGGKGVAVHTVDGTEYIYTTGFYRNAESGMDEFYLARLSIDGAPDSAFGLVKYGDGTKAYAGRDIAFDSNDRALCSTEVIVEGDDSHEAGVYVLAAKADGSELDIANFGTDGLAKYDVPDDTMFIGNYPVGIQSTGRVLTSFILVTATDWEDPLTYKYSGNVLGYTAAGVLDTAFATEGSISSSKGMFQHVIVDAFDRVVAFGGGGSDFNDITTMGFTLGRYASDGTLDDGFGTDGIVTTVGSVAGGTAEDAEESDKAGAAVYDANGILYVGGTSCADADCEANAMVIEAYR